MDAVLLNMLLFDWLLSIAGGKMCTFNLVTSVLVRPHEKYIKGKTGMDIYFQEFS